VAGEGGIKASTIGCGSHDGKADQQHGPRGRLWDGADPGIYHRHIVREGQANFYWTVQCIWTCYHLLDRNYQRLHRRGGEEAAEYTVAATAMKIRLTAAEDLTLIVSEWSFDPNVKMSCTERRGVADRVGPKNARAAIYVHSEKETAVRRIGGTADLKGPLLLLKGGVHGEGEGGCLGSARKKNKNYGQDKSHFPKSPKPKGHFTFPRRLSQSALTKDKGLTSAENVQLNLERKSPQIGRVLIFKLLPLRLRQLLPSTTLLSMADVGPDDER
jgi:hypothetical protein